MKPETPYKLNDKEIEMCSKLISKAKTAFADPSQSGYFVQAAGVTENDDMVAGGNKENSSSDAFVHGETAVISHIRDIYGKTPIKAIGFYKDGHDITEKDISPCGACRDVLVQQTSPDLLLMSGNQNKIVVLKLKDFIFDDFHRISSTDLDGVGLKEATIALYKGVDVYLPEYLKRKVYGVSIVDQNSNNFRGSLYTNSGYDAITPGLAAVQTWNNSEIDKTNINKIVIVGRNALPSPYYRDRQALLELTEITYQNSVRVELISLDNFDNIQEVATTNTTEWLPRPFSAGNFGMHEAIRDQHNKMFY